MLRRAVFSEAEDVRFDVGLGNQKAGQISAAGTQLLVLGLAVGEYHDGGLLRHFNNVPVIVRAYRVGNLEQSLLVGAAIGKRVRHDDAAIYPPCLSEPAALGDRRVIKSRI